MERLDWFLIFSFEVYSPALYFKYHKKHQNKNRISFQDNLDCSSERTIIYNTLEMMICIMPGYPHTKHCNSISSVKKHTYATLLLVAMFKCVEYCLLSFI